MRDLIIDTDIGDDIDDLWALVYILSKTDFNVVLIAVTSGDVEYKKRLVSKVLHELHLSGSIPVVGGRPGTGIHPQERWLDGYAYDGSGTSYSEAMEKALGDHPSALIVLLGPVNDFASFIESNVYPKARGHECFYMGGAIQRGYINQAGPGGESNFANSPEATSFLLSNMDDLTLVPLDVCRDFIVSGEEYARLLESRSAYSKVIIDNYRIWNEDYVGGAIKYDPDHSSSILYDVVVPLSYLHPERFLYGFLDIEVDGGGACHILESSGKTRVLLESLDQKAGILEVVEALS